MERYDYEYFGSLHDYVKNQIEDLKDFLYYYKRSWNNLSLNKASKQGCLCFGGMQEIAFLRAKKEVEDKKARELEKKASIDWTCGEDNNILGVNNEYI